MLDKTDRPFIPFNMNYGVMVQLTDAGRAHYRKWHYDLVGDKLAFHPKEEDADGRSQWQLWNLMQVFGEAIYLGNPDPPFKTDIRLLPE